MGLITVSNEANFRISVAFVRLDRIKVSIDFKSRFFILAWYLVWMLLIVTRKNFLLNILIELKCLIRMLNLWKHRLNLWIPWKIKQINLPLALEYWTTLFACMFYINKRSTCMKKWWATIQACTVIKINSKCNSNEFFKLYL